MDLYSATFAHDLVLDSWLATYNVLLFSALVTQYSALAPASCFLFNPKSSIRNPDARRILDPLIP